MKLQTKRLVLRPFEDSDAEALYKYAKSPNVGPASGWEPHSSVEESREIIRELLSTPETFAVELKETGEVVGCASIMTSDSVVHLRDVADDECELGYWIGEPYWGQGLIPEAVVELTRYAFEVLQKTTIWCGHLEGNEQSRRVQEKCGFAYSHTEYHKLALSPDEFYTVLYYKLTLDEWRGISDQ